MVALDSGQLNPSPGGREIILRDLPAFVESSSQVRIIHSRCVASGSRWIKMGGDWIGRWLLSR